MTRCACCGGKATPSRPLYEARTFLAGRFPGTAMHLTCGNNAARTVRPRTPLTEGRPYAPKRLAGA